MRLQNCLATKSEAGYFKKLFGILGRLWGWIKIWETKMKIHGNSLNDLRSILHTKPNLLLKKS